MHTPHHDEAASENGSLRIALGEYDTGWHDPEASVRSAEGLVERASAGGARLVVLPEMMLTGFTIDPEQAVTLDSPPVGRLRAQAAQDGVWLIAGVALRESGQSHPVNVAMAISPSGEIVGMHRKQRLFAYAEEHAHYREGSVPTVVEMDGMRVGLFVCYELRFPELFRAVARDVQAMVVIANWPVSRRAHWDALLAARAIENQCYVIGVNRTGEGGGLAYDGGSCAIDPMGARIDARDGDVRFADVTPTVVAEVRSRFPFLDDMR